MTTRLTFGLMALRFRTQPDHHCLLHGQDRCRSTSGHEQVIFSIVVSMNFRISIDVVTNIHLKITDRQTTHTHKLRASHR